MLTTATVIILLLVSLVIFTIISNIAWRTIYKQCPSCRGNGFYYSREPKPGKSAISLDTNDFSSVKRICERCDGFKWIRKNSE